MPKFQNPESIVNSICGAIIKTVTFFKDGKLSKALSKQSITEELLKSGFSPWVQSKTLLYETLDKLKEKTTKGTIKNCQ